MAAETWDKPHWSRLQHENFNTQLLLEQLKSVKEKIKINLYLIIWLTRYLASQNIIKLLKMEREGGGVEGD